MAAFTTAQAGNWSDSATWSGNGPQIPGAGDTVTIGHAVTVDVATTVGTDENQSVSGAYAVDQTSAGSLTVAAGVVFTVQGDCQFDCTNNGPVLSAGATWRWGGTAGQVYFALLGTGHYQANALLTCNGTAVSRCTVESASGGPIGYFSRNGFLGTGMLDATYTDFVRIGNASNSGFECALSQGGDIFSMTNCTVDTCGEFRPDAGTMNGNAILRVEDVQFTSSQGGYSARYYGYNAIGASGTRSLLRVSYDGPVYFNAPVDFSIDYVYFAGAFIASSSGGPWASFTNNLVRDTDQGPTTVQSDVTDCYMLKHGAIANPHFIQLTTARNVVVDGVVFELTGTDSGGDCVLPGSPSAARTYTVQNCLAIPNGGDTASGVIWALLGNANVTLNSERNTYLGPASGVGATIGETYTGHAGMVPYHRNSLAWSPAASSGYILGDIGTQDAVADYVTTADYNGYYQLAGQYDVAAGVITNPAGANDVNADPAFTDSSRDLASWGTSEGADGTVDGALALVAADPSRITALVTWVKDGFAPTNTAFQGTASDGGDIGAVAVTTSGTTVAVGLATETDTAPAVGAAKTASVGVASETDTAPAVGAARTVAVGAATESDSAPAVGSAKSLAVGIAAEADTAPSVGAAKTLAVGLASETDTAPAVTASLDAGIIVAVGLATETSTALALSWAKVMGVGIAVETDTAPALLFNVVPRYLILTAGIAPRLTLDADATPRLNLTAGLEP